MIIAETKTWEVGRYTIRQQPRSDNPAWPKYLVFHGEHLVGSTFSSPDESCCEWLETQQKIERMEARALASASDGRRGSAGRRGSVERDSRAYLTTTNAIK